jgi:release factor glutamine methyltransferase
VRIAEALHSAEQALAQAGVPSPRNDAQILLAHVCHVLRTELHAIDSLTTEQQAAFAALVARRVTREPLQHLTGLAWFRHLELLVGPGVFIPRPETELLVTYALEQLPKSGPITVVELCAGSGAISLALATERANTKVIAVELSADAVSWLKRNVTKYESELAGCNSSVTVIQADATQRDLLSDLNGTVTAVLTNPPYIPDAMIPREIEVVKHDPALALYGGHDGLEIIRGILPNAARLLTPAGLLLIEHADVQGDSLPQLLAEFNDWTDIVDLLDYTQKPRHTFAKRK